MTTATLELAPNRRVAAPVLPELPKCILCEVLPIGGGDFRLRPLGEEWVTLTPSVKKAIGVERSARTLYRLHTAGFVRLRKISPGVWQLHVPSFLAHCKAVEADQYFWDDTERRKRWRKAIE